jgi:predicted transcriptional regulator
MDTIQITARVAAELAERLDRFADQTHRSRAGAIAFLLERGLEQEQAQRQPAVSEKGRR